MNSEQLKGLIYKTPFQPVRLTLHAGPPVVIRHPENIAVSSSWVAIAQDPDPPHFFEADMVVSVEYLPEVIF